MNYLEQLIYNDIVNNTSVDISGVEFVCNDDVCFNIKLSDCIYIVTSEQDTREEIFNLLNIGDIVKKWNSVDNLAIEVEIKTDIVYLKKFLSKQVYLISLVDNDGDQFFIELNNNYIESKLVNKLNKIFKSICL